MGAVTAGADVSAAIRTQEINSNFVSDITGYFDIGAGTHGIKTDCHDATHTTFTDFSSAGPTTWGGCHPIGVSTGLNYKF